MGKEGDKLQKMISNKCIKAFENLNAFKLAGSDKIHFTVLKELL